MAELATKERAHLLIERIDSSQVPAAVEWLEKLVDPVAFSLAHAPLEDEEIGEAEERAARKSRERGRVFDPDSHRLLLEEVGLTVEAFESMGWEAVMQQ